MTSLETCILNVFARKILGVSRTARIPILHAALGVISAHNLFIQHCASMVDLGLRASHGTLQSRLDNWLCGGSDMPSWEVDTHKLQLPLSFPPHVAELRYLDFDGGESWRFQMLPSLPETPLWMRAPLAYH